MKKFRFSFRQAFPLLNLLFFVLFLHSGWAQCTLTSGTYTEAQVETCLSDCSCSTIIIPTGATVNLDGDWDLTDQGDLEIRIVDSGSLVFSGNGGSAEELSLTANSYIIIEDITNTSALTQSGGNGTVRINVGIVQYTGSDFAAVISSGGINTILPVELLSFRVTVKGHLVVLYWETASEVNNLGFEIQRSDDGYSWIPIDFIEGHYNSNISRDYSYIDISPPSTKLLYYRLRQIDVDQQYSFSPIQFISLVRGEDDNSLFLSPNPSDDRLHYFFQGSINPGTLSIYAISSGKLMYSAKNVSQSGEIDLSAFDSGVYILKMADSQHVNSERFIIK